MSIERRSFLKAGAALAAITALPQQARAADGFDPQPGAWRQFALKTRIEIKDASGASQAWIPVPSIDAEDWIRAGDNAWTTNAKSAALVEDGKYGAKMLHAVWDEGEAAPALELTSRIATRDRAIDLGRPGAAATLSDAQRALYTEGTALIPVDGLVRRTAEKIVAGKATDLEKARAIYEWIAANTFRDAKVRGCGIGDVSAMLENGYLGGKCADLNALFVGLARAAGLPARDVYGIRVAKSKFGYQSLGAKSEVVTKAQHCRAEVFLDGFGWVPADPADVRKVALEEPPGNLAIDDPKVDAARKTLFGAWEGNWLAYNAAHDVALPGTGFPALGFLMYPQAETGAFLLDCLDPDQFRYEITAEELPV